MGIDLIFLNKFLQAVIHQSDYRLHILWPTLSFIITLTVITGLSLDNRLADLIFQWGNGAWVLRDNWLTETVIHEGGRKLIGVLFLVLLLMLSFTYLNQSGRQYRAGLWYVLLTALISAVLINLLKEFTGMDCPWDISRYGGVKTFHSLLDFSLPNQSPGRCFPAGHASAGYAWFGLYFFCRQYFPTKNRIALVSVIILGMVFGVAQQLRGAHFLSHDIWTAWLCWVVATLLAQFHFFSKEINTVFPAASPDKMDG